MRVVRLCWNPYEEFCDVLQQDIDVTLSLDVENFADVMVAATAIALRTKTCCEFALTVAVG